MDKYILTVTVNPALDRTLILKDFKIGESRVFNKEYLSAGGKGLNVARALKFFGVDVLATGILAPEDGKTIEDLTRQEKLKTDFFYASQGRARTHITIIAERLKQKTRVLSLGPKISQDDLRLFKIKYKALVGKSSFVVLSGRKANGASDSYYAELVSLAHKAGVGCAVDTSGKSLLEAIKIKPFMIKPNLEEAQEILKEKLNNLSKIKQALRFFHEKGVKIILLSLGEKGVIGSYKNEIIKVFPPRIKVCQDVGCGDVFLAGFVASYKRNNSFQKSLEFAVAAGTAQAMQYQIGVVDLKQQRRILKKLRVENIY